MQNNFNNIRPKIVSDVFQFVLAMLSCHNEYSMFKQSPTSALASKTNQRASECNGSDGIAKMLRQRRSIPEALSEQFKQFDTKIFENISYCFVSIKLLICSINVSENRPTSIEFDTFHDGHKLNALINVSPSSSFRRSSMASNAYRNRKPHASPP